MTSIKKVRRKIIRLVVTGTLASAQGAMAGVLAHDHNTSRDEKSAHYQTLPSDVRGGSIRVDEERHGVSVPVALVSAEDAVQTAVAAGFPSVVSAELETESGYLVWAVEVGDAKNALGSVIVDAGTGRLLAFVSA